MTDSYIKLGVAALLPVAVALILYLLESKTAFGRVKYGIRQAIIGVLFGILAIVGTEWGIPINGAQVNCRDAAVLTAGLLFGAPAGIIAGLIGAVERWVAVAWGVGTYTRLACSISTAIAGFYSAALRKLMFEDKKPSWTLSLAIGVVMEVIHLSMVFVTNLSTTTQAIAVVQACTAPMLTANGLSVMLATLAVSVAAGENLGIDRGTIRISQTIQRWMLLAVVVAFVITTAFVSRVQTSLCSAQTDSKLRLTIEEVSLDFQDALDSHLLTTTKEIAALKDSADINTLAALFDVAEINYVDKSGKIFESTNPGFIRFDFHSGEQSREFLCLLKNKSEFIQAYGPIAYDNTIMRKYAGVETDYGFLQVGYNAEQFQRGLLTSLQGITKNRHVGENGFAIVINSNYEIVSSPRWLGPPSLAQAMTSDNEPDKTFLLTQYGQEYYVRYRIVEGYYIAALLPVSEAVYSRDVVLYLNTFMEILVFALLFALIYQIIKRVVVNRLQKVNQSLSRITGGDLEERVNVQSNEEFASLSREINSTVDSLKNYIAEAASRIDQELEFAKNIQFSALPRIFPAFPKHKEIDIFATMDPAKEVGGDFYDFYLYDGTQLSFLVADVSGKGIPAAMFMMRSKTELKSLTETGMPLNDVFTHGNAALCEGNDAGMFVTAWQGSLDLETGHLRYVNAGHNPPLIQRKGQPYEYLRSRAGFVLAGMDTVKYKAQEMQLEPGDRIFLYTDGVTEATNAEEELYGEDRLLEIVNRSAGLDCQSLCKAVKQDVDAFVGDAPQFDDITMLALTYVGQDPGTEIHFDKAAISDIPAATEFLEEELARLGCEPKAIMQVNVALDEIFSNIVQYAYEDAPGPITIKVRERSNPHSVRIVFVDDGIPYNPLTRADPDTTLSAEERGIGGLGIFLVKKMMDDVQYRYENGKNILILTKLLSEK